jgi:hypothetical protein
VAVATSASNYTALAKQTEALPVGGLAGQALIKNTSGDFDASWAAPSAQDAQRALDRLMSGQPMSVYDIMSLPNDGT